MSTRARVSVVILLLFFAAATLRAQPAAIRPTEPPSILDPSVLPAGPPTVLVPQALGPLDWHGLVDDAELAAEMEVLSEAWAAEREAFLTRVEETPYTLEDLEAATRCLAEGGDCNSPVARLLTEELTGRGQHVCGTEDVALIAGLATRVATIERIGGLVEALPVPPPPLETHAGCGPKRFRSRSGRFDLFYDDCDPRLRDAIDTASSFTDLTGASVALTAGGRVYGAGNAPDTVELTAVLLDSAFAVMSGDFALRAGARRYQVRLEDPPLAALTGAVGYVNPVDGVAMISPSALPSLATPDLRARPTSVAVHEFIHQVQFDYGWNLGSILFDDNFNLQNLGPDGRQLLESSAEAVTNHVHWTLPVYFPFRRETNYYDFWAGQPGFGGRNPLGFGWILQALSNDPTGTVCTGCEIAHQMFVFFGTNTWSRDALFRFVAARDPRLTPLEIPRQYFLHEVYDRFANLPPELVRSNQRLPISVFPGIVARSFAPDANTCQLPAGTSYAIRSRDGSTVRCRFRPFPASDNGIPQMVYLPVDSLPEQLLVRIDISYRDARNGRRVNKIGGRLLENSVRILEASGDRTAFDDRLVAKNRILRSHEHVWSSGGHLEVIDTYGIDRASRRPDYSSQMRALAFVFEWQPTPPLANLQPTWEITVQSKRLDADLDGVADRDDLCPLDPDPGNANLDGDRFGDLCDDDLDGDRIPNATDLCPRIAGACAADRDGDNLANASDNCPEIDNWDQADGDGDGVGDVCDGDSKPDLVVTFGGVPPAGAGFEIKNVGTAPATGPLHYEVSAYVTEGGLRVLRRATLEFPLPRGGLLPGHRASTEIPEHVIDPARPGAYQNVAVYIDSELEVEELEEGNNSRKIH